LIYRIFYLHRKLINNFNNILDTFFLSSLDSAIKVTKSLINANIIMKPFDMLFFKPVLPVENKTTMNLSYGVKGVFYFFFINIYYLATEIHDDIFVTLKVERLFSEEFCIPDVQTRTRGLNGIRKWRLRIRLSWNLKFKNTTSRPFGNFFVFRWQSTINEFCISHQKFWACVVWNTI